MVQDSPKDLGEASLQTKLLTSRMPTYEYGLLAGLGLAASPILHVLEITECYHWITYDRSRVQIHTGIQVVFCQSANMNASGL